MMWKAGTVLLAATFLFAAYNVSAKDKDDEKDKHKEHPQAHEAKQGHPPEHKAPQKSASKPHPEHKREDGKKLSAIAAKGPHKSSHPANAAQGKKGNQPGTPPEAGAPELPKSAVRGVVTAKSSGTLKQERHGKADSGSEVANDEFHEAEAFSNDIYFHTWQRHKDARIFIHGNLLARRTVKSLLAEQVALILESSQGKKGPQFLLGSDDTRDAKRLKIGEEIVIGCPSPGMREATTQIPDCFLAPWVLYRYGTSPSAARHANGDPSHPNPRPEPTAQPGSGSE